jgi:MYXO-CTERM domain-containing protein
MVDSFRRVMMSTCLLVGCAADVLQDDHDLHASVESGELPAPRTPEASVRCDGTPLPECDGAFTGASCDLPCSGPAGEVTATQCGLDVYCHSNGSVYGLATRNAVLYRGAPDDDEPVVESDFEAWIVGHAADVGLEAGLAPSNLELHRLEGFRSAAGPLTIFRFSQTYDGLPVLAPDGIVTLVYGPQGAISASGAIVDNRVEYEHRHRQASEAKAKKSILKHTSAQEGVPVDELDVVHLTRVAMPMARAIGWVGSVREKDGGAMLARVIVDADPVLAGAVLPLLSYRELAVSELKDTQPIQVRSLDPSGEPGTLTYDIEGTLTTDGLLLGSVHDASSEIQLASERVVVLDLHGELQKEIATYGTRILDPSGVFDEDSGTELVAQVAYHLFQGWYDFIDGHLTEPETGAKRWDSTNILSSNGKYPSDTPPGTYAPRVLASADASRKDCPAHAVACATAIGYGLGSPQATAFPELLHIPTGATNPESLGHVKLLGDDIEPVTFAHEFGHIIDLFTGGGMTLDFAPGCDGPCTAECVENTTDEVPPLTESIAQLFALVFLRQSFEGVDFEYCPIVSLVAVGGSKPWTPGSCIPPGEDISLFLRNDACAFGHDQYCDKPDHPGFDSRCCFDDEDLTDCTLAASDECPIGEEGPNGGMGTGTARPIPTGLCDKSPGYRTISLYQAFWQMLNGQRCEPTPPFACESVEWASDTTPLDATTAALLYAARVNALTYEQLFDAMGTYIACTYGDTAYGEFNAIACGHGIRDCDAPSPMTCESCGNGVREGGETCDGTDWLLPRCDVLPEYAGGTLTCDQSTCTLDESQCSMPGLDTTAGTGTPPEDPSRSSSTTGPVEETETWRMGGEDPDDGCACRASGARAGWLLTLLSFALLGAKRRRRRL